MPTLELTNFNIVVSVLGGWVSLFGLVSYLCKEKFYLSEARTYFHTCSFWDVGHLGYRRCGTQTTDVRS